MQGHPTLAITTGDPGGIGPEVIVKALAEPARRARARHMILGPATALELAAFGAGIQPFWESIDPAARGWPDGPGVWVIDHPASAEAMRPRATAAGGELSFQLVERAIELAQHPEDSPQHADAIVTGPISKDAWRLAGHGDVPGHTELLAQRFGARRYGMLFVSPPLRVMLATVHIPLLRVPAALTPQRLDDTIELAHESCVGLGISEPRVAVCGLNPHAGENGLLGQEDLALIAPAIERARTRGLDVSGPWPGDTVWTAAAAPPLGRGEFDLVVAMYHDQGLIPVKLVAWDRAVNVTVGLPAVRTSPDHGTAFDIAGKNRANPGSMAAALDLAVELAQRRRGV